jgi:hypothetical protein
MPGEDRYFLESEYTRSCWRLAFLRRANVVGPTAFIAVFMVVEAGSPRDSLIRHHVDVTQCRNIDL